MNTIPDVYLFGQVLGTHSFLLKDGFLQPDAYAEIVWTPWAYRFAWTAHGTKKRLMGGVELG